MRGVLHDSHLLALIGEWRLATGDRQWQQFEGLELTHEIEGEEDGEVVGLENGRRNPSGAVVGRHETSFKLRV